MGAARAGRADIVGAEAGAPVAAGGGPEGAAGGPEAALAPTDSLERAMWNEHDHVLHEASGNFI